MPTRAPLRWVGGKQHLTATLLAELASWGDANTYFEPFFGGGSLFFNKAPFKAVLGDLNPDLILFYQFLRDHPSHLRREAEGIDSAGTKQEYDCARTEFNNGASGIRRAALFLYLNRTGFNGIWRVNRNGSYTVPYGQRRLALIAEKSWLAASDALGSAELRTSDYRPSLSKARSGDFVFLDPPYMSSTGLEVFARYTPNGFKQIDHEELAQEVARLTSLNVRVLMTVREDPWLLDLYASYSIITAPVRAVVGAKGNHHQLRDLVIRNYTT